MSASENLNEFESLLLENLRAADATDQLVVALSGGLDSKALLHALVRLADVKLVGSFQAVHLDHGLQEGSEHWLKQCEQDCQHYQIHLISRQLNLAESHSSNLEAAAREARYQFFTDIIEPKQILLLAHHLDDQAETLLFRLLRGCGIQGARAMPSTRPLGQGKLLRPMLSISRQQIEDYAREQKLSWVTDPSNQDPHYARNYLRHQVMPVLKKRWPSYAKTLARFAQIAGEQSQLLDELAAEDFAQASTNENLIEIDKLLLLSKPRQKNLLHYWGNKLSDSAPSSTEIIELLRQLSNLGQDAKPIKVRLAGGWARSFTNRLYFLSDKEPMPFTQKIKWHNIQQAIELPNGYKLCAELCQSGLRLPLADEIVWIKQRQGSENCLPDYRQKSTSLKKIYQEKSVPPWLREWLPIIYYNDRVAAVPGVFVDKAFLSQAGEQALDLSVSLLRNN